MVTAKVPYITWNPASLNMILQEADTEVNLTAPFLAHRARGLSPFSKGWCPHKIHLKGAGETTLMIIPKGYKTSLICQMQQDPCVPSDWSLVACLWKDMEILHFPGVHCPDCRIWELKPNASNAFAFIWCLFKARHLFSPVIAQGLSSVCSSEVTAWSQTMRHSTKAESSRIHLIHQHIMLFWRSNILPFLREFKIDFHLSGLHPEPISKRQTCSLWSVGLFILWLIRVGSQSALRMWIAELFCITAAGFLTSSIICKPIIDLSWLQVQVLSQCLLQTQAQGEIKGKKITSK